MIASLQCVVLDCPDDVVLVSFYHRPPRWPDPAHPQQLHLDLAVADLDAAHERAVSAGAIPLASATPWRIYADPAGHPFCLIPH